jgi:hypothetical protein
VVKLCACGQRKKRGNPRFCEECWLSRQPSSVQTEAAEARRELVPEHMRRGRVSPDKWPPGRRWCAGCQTFVRLSDCTESRCRACASASRHAGDVMRTYGIDEATYRALWAAQGGRCYICQRRIVSKRPAVDHDHATGEVRGLLCPDNERGCNRAILGSIESSARTLEEKLALVARISEYLINPPARIIDKYVNGSDS